MFIRQPKKISEDVPFLFSMSRCCCSVCPGVVVQYVQVLLFSKSRCCSVFPIVVQYVHGVVRYIQLLFSMSRCC